MAILTTSAMIAIGFLIGMYAHPVFELKCTMLPDGGEHEVFFQCERVK
jgi:hypothetical protein